MNNSKRLSRRRFLKHVSQGSLALSAALSPARALTAPLLEDRKSYDAIVVGSGPGGATVACRLVEAGKHVLLIEAGNDVIKDTVSIPGLHLQSTEDPEISWDYFVRHYRKESDHGFKFSQKEGGVLYPRVGALGGCTLHNAMIGLYPNLRDFRIWEEATGDSRFSAEFMRRIYEEKVLENVPLETTSPTLALKDAQLLRMYTAALEVGLEHETGNSFAATAELFKTLGSLDPNSDENVRNGAQGLFLLPKITRNGQRWSTRDLIKQTQQRFPGRLEVSPNTLVKRVIFSDQTRSDAPLRAVGVEVIQSQDAYEASSHPNLFSPLIPPKTLFAREEVILAAGAYNSPQLLMLSGIGDTAELNRLGIRTRKHLPGVGKNLQDRYEIALVSKAPKPFALTEDCTFGQPNDPCMEDYRKDPDSALYASNGLVAGLKLKSDPDLEEPDLMIFGGPVSFKGYYPGYSKDALAHKDRFSWAVLKGQTRNRAGTVKLRSTSPFERPEIQFNYFDQGANEDISSLRVGLSLTRRILKRANLYQKLSLSKSHEELWPGRSVRGAFEEEKFIRQESWGHHASCSNAMGRESDPRSVVGGNFKVDGTQNLRVVDASVFPEIPGLFIVLPIFMIAEKAALDIFENR